MAKDLHPGKRNSLDALCERYQVDNSKRTLHGALLDAELTARVYLELVGGRQTHLVLAPRDGEAAAEIVTVAITRPAPLPPRVTDQERETHAVFVAKELGTDAVWNWR